MKIAPLVLALRVQLLAWSTPFVHGRVTCTAGRFLLGEQGGVTCHFRRDVNQTQHNFNVVRYPLPVSAETGDVGTYVLLCNWGASGNLECKEEDGYSFNNHVSDELTVSIHNVSTAEEGQYACQLVPGDGTLVDTCSLTVGRCPETDSQPQVLSRDSGGNWHSHNIGTVLLASAGLLLLLAICIAFRKTICLQWKKTKRRYGAQEDELVQQRLTNLEMDSTTQSHAVFCRLDKEVQIGETTVIQFSNVETQVGEKGRQFLTGILKGDKNDSVLYGSAVRFIKYENQQSKANSNTASEEPTGVNPDTNASSPREEKNDSSKCVIV